MKKNMPSYLLPTRLFFISLIFIALQGCVSTSPQGSIPPGQYDRSKIEQLHNWQAEGKVAVKINNKNQSANFAWKQQKENSYIHLFGPLGQGSVYLTNHNGQICLQQKSETRCAQTAETLLQENLGWTIPISDITYWIKGIPSPDSAVQSFQPPLDNSLSAHLEQQGWHIEYKSYQSVSQLLLPRKLTATRGAVTLTLIVKHWSLSQ